MDSKVGMLSVLVLGVMMLLIPATSMASVQEYDSYYNNNDDDEYIYEKDSYLPKDGKMKKEPPMIKVNKEVLFCDVIADGNSSDCSPNFPGPNSGRYVEECTATTGIFGEICDTVDEDFFDIVVTDDIKFPGSNDGTKINFTGDVFYVTEKDLRESAPLCEKAGFDSAIFEMVDGLPVGLCVLFEGDCSGFVHDGELKECTVKNYLVNVGTAKLTVNKEIYGCENVSTEPNNMNCSFDNGDPDWILCDDLQNPDASIFCDPLLESDFDIQVFDSNNIIIDPPGQFEGSTEGEMIMNLEPGLYNIEEIENPRTNPLTTNQLVENTSFDFVCTVGANFVSGGEFQDQSQVDQSDLRYAICFEYEDENGDPCDSVLLRAGQEETCTVKNYIFAGQELSQ